MKGVWLGYVGNISSVCDFDCAVIKQTYQTLPHGVLDLGDLDLAETFDFL